MRSLLMVLALVLAGCAVREPEVRTVRVEVPVLVLCSMRPAKSSPQPRNASTWCALKFRWAPVLAF